MAWVAAGKGIGADAAPNPSEGSVELIGDDAPGSVAISAEAASFTPMPPGSDESSTRWEQARQMAKMRPRLSPVTKR